MKREIINALQAMNRSGKAPGTCEKHQKKIGQIEKVVERRNKVVHIETEWIGILFLLAVLFLGSPVHANMPGIEIFSTDGDTAYNNAANPDQIIRKCCSAAF